MQIPGPVGRLDTATLLQLEADRSLTDHDHREVVIELARLSAQAPIESSPDVRPGVSRIPLCHSCGCDGYRKLSLIHAGGISLSEGSTRGIGMTLGGSIGIGGASTTTATQTALSAIASPPERRSAAVEAVAIGFLIMLLGLVVFASVHWAIVPIVACGLAVGVAVWQYRRSNTQFTLEYDAARAKWDRSYMCDRCGDIALL